MSDKDLKRKPLSVKPRYTLGYMHKLGTGILLALAVLFLFRPQAYIREWEEVPSLYFSFLQQGDYVLEYTLGGPSAEGLVIRVMSETAVDQDNHVGMVFAQEALEQDAVNGRLVFSLEQDVRDVSVQILRRTEGAGGISGSFEGAEGLSERTVGIERVLGSSVGAEGLSENSVGAERVSVRTEEAEGASGSFVGAEGLSENSVGAGEPSGSSVEMAGYLEDAGEAVFFAEARIQSVQLLCTDHYLMSLLCLLAALGIVFLGLYVPADRYRMPLLMAGFGLLASLPMGNDFLIETVPDTGFHLARLESVYQGLRAGEFPVRIGSVQMGGYGSLSAVMYPQLFLYPAAVLRFFRVSLMMCYKLLVTGLNVGSVLLAYYAVKNICRSEKTGVIACFLYAFSIYRLIDVYQRGALGESLAMTFLPLIMWGIYEILWGNHRRWYLLALGVSAVLQSHVLSVEMSVFFLVAAVVVRCLQRERRHLGVRILAGVKAAVLTVLLNASFLIPFLYFCGEDLQCFHMPNELPESLLYLNQMFFSFAHVDGVNQGPGTLAGEMPLTVGGVLFLGMMLFVAVAAGNAAARTGEFGAARVRTGESVRAGAGTGELGRAGAGAGEPEAAGVRTGEPGTAGERAGGQKTAVGRHEERVGTFCLVCGLAALALTSWIFPWEALSKIPVFDAIACSLQFAWRFLGPASLFLCVTTAVGLKLFEERGQGRRWIYACVLLLVFLSTSYFFEMSARESRQSSDKMAINGYNITDSLYMYYDGESFKGHHMNPAWQIPQMRSAGQQASYSGLRRQGSGLQVKVTPGAASGDVLIFPIYFYPGYQVTVNGEAVEGYEYNAQLACDMPLEPAEVKVRYTGPAVFRIGDVLSLCTFITCVIYIMPVRRSFIRRKK